MKPNYIDLNDQWRLLLFVNSLVQFLTSLIYARLCYTCGLTETPSSGPSPEFNDWKNGNCNTEELIFYFAFLFKIETYKSLFQSKIYFRHCSFIYSIPIILSFDSMVPPYTVLQKTGTVNHMFDTSLLIKSSEF